MPEKRHICPNNCGDEFITTAHVVQDWKVDGLGNFIEAVNPAVETTHKPDVDNIWTCATCGTEAILSE